MVSMLAALLVTVFTINPPSPVHKPPAPAGYMQYPLPSAYPSSPCFNYYGTYQHC